MFINNFDPVAFSIFAIDIRWYSLSYIIGIIFGWYYCKKKLITEERYKPLFDDYIFYLILGIIIGGRLGYVLIYNLEYYLNNLHEVLFIWQGGMSFHGALVGIIFATYYFSIKHKIDIFYFLDLVALSAPIGIFFGRISNFINSELYGTETNMPWAVKFIQVDNLYRHPSQLYEAILEGLILFIILIIFRNKGFLNFPGFISGMFLAFYSLFRFIIEFFRVPDEQIGYLIFNLTMGQIISSIFFIFGIYLMTTKYEIETKK